MLITALVAEASSGYLSLKASVMLASLVTVILFPWALATVRCSPLLSAMMLALIGMTWRAEAWKAAYLEAEVQLRQEQLLLPKRASIRHGAWKVHVASTQLYRLIAPSIYRSAFEYQYQLNVKNPSSVEDQLDTFPIGKEAKICLSSDRFLSELEAPRLLPYHPQQGISAEEILNFHTESEATPVKTIARGFAQLFFLLNLLIENTLPFSSYRQGALAPRLTRALVSSTGSNVSPRAGLLSVICSTCRKASWLTSRFGTLAIWGALLLKARK